MSRFFRPPPYPYETLTFTPPPFFVRPPPLFCQRMVAVASRAPAASPSLSFWKHARGSDPFGSNNGGYTGSYAGARNSGGRGGGGRGGGTSGHWAADTSVENPHGPGNAVRLHIAQESLVVYAASTALAILCVRACVLLL